ncbi:C-type lectin domain family 4 member E [Oncorhynchus tshawytscha]|uniref:C-type lectin domain-containing protein n=1 Tax=Oncorhynchus tshawytscha TaxID=74940 RepID=A0AAZ3RWM0_ONCTS|nr:C-type lectin domain family 4 member E [Oncorhynchus tshawytscha]
MCSGLDKKKPHNSNLTFRAHSVHLVTLDIFTHQCNIFGRISFQLSKTVVENPTMQTMDIDKDTYANKPRKKDYIGVTFSGWKKFKSSLYYLSTEKKSWTESRQDCLGRGAHLVIINSKEEQEFIHEWSGCLEIYLGFHDTNTEGVWEWINDGALDQSSAPVTTYWRDGEPNDANQGEDCAHLSKMASDPLKSWNDVPCTMNKHWMCEKTTSTL